MWRTVKLGEICKIVNGSTPSRKEKAFWEGGDIPWFTIDDMREQGRDIFTTAQHVTQRAMEEKKVKLVPKNSVLLCCTASIGEAAIARKEMATNQQFNSLTPLTTDLSCEYLYYVTTTLKNKLLRVSGSTTISFVSVGKLKEIEIPLPPLAEQQRIVAKLDAAFAEIDRAVEAAKRQQEHLTRLSAAVLTFQLFRKSWATKPLSDVLQTGAGGTPLKSEKHFYDGGNIPWLLSGAVCEKDITESKTHITEEGLANSSAKLFPAGTVLVAMYGATAGQVGILRTEAATNQAVCGIYPHQNFLPEFLFYYFTGYKSTLLNEVSGVAQPNLSQAKIRNVPLPVISVSDQRAVVRELDSAFSKIEALTDALSKKQNAYLSLKSAILAQELQPQQSDAA